MNKYVILLLVLVGLVGAGIVYRTFLLPDSQKPVNTGVVREISIKIPKNSWTFDPESIEANRGDTLKLTFVNEDDYDHGVGIDAYGVSQRIPAHASVAISPFVVTKGGDFQFYCSVSCSEGVAETGAYKGERRGHFEQIGVLHVKELGERDGAKTSTAPSAPAILVPHVPEAVTNAKSVIAKELGVSVDAVKVAYMGSKVWKDSCLELPAQTKSETCTKVPTPGYEIVLRVSGVDYAYRLDEQSLIRAISKELLSPH